MNIVAYYAPELDDSSTGREISAKVKEYLFFPLPDLTFPLPVGTLIKFSDIAQNVEGAEEFSDGDVWFKIALVEYEPAKSADTIFLRLIFEDCFDIDIDNLIKCLRAKGKE